MQVGSERQISVPQVAPGILAAALVALASRYLILQPALGQVNGRDGSMLLLFFLLGYLAFPIAPDDQAPLPLASWNRLRTGLLYAIIAGLTVILPDRLWP